MLVVTKQHAEYMSADELWSRCLGAAKLAARGANYDADARQEIAAQVLIEVWEDATKRSALREVRTRVRSSLHGPAVTYSKRNAQKSKDDLEVWAKRPALRRDLVPFSRLYGIACNRRRTIDRDRDRDAHQAARNAAGFVPHVEAPGQDAESRGTVEGAHRTAREMLDALGLARLGRAYPAAYAAARVAAGWERADIASELNAPSVEACWKNIQRAAARVPSAKHLSPRDHAEALHVPDGGLPLKPSKSRTATAEMPGADWRTAPRRVAPVSVRLDASVKRDGRRAYARPDWTTTLPSATAARLGQASEVRRAREAARTSTERKRLRLAAGLPGTFR